MKRLLVSLVLGFLFFGCGEKLSEKEQYEELKSSMKYELYTKASKSAMPLIHSQLKKEMNENFPKDLTIDDAHIILSLLFVTSMKADFAIAESNILLNKKLNQEKQYISNSILALGMYEKGWQKLANEHSKYTQSLIENPNIQDLYYEKQVIAYLAIGLLSINNKDYETAQVSFAALGTLTNFTLLSDILNPLLQIRDGHYQEGMINLKALQNHPQLPEEEKKIVKKLIISIEARYGKVESTTFIFNILADLIITKMLKDNPDTAMSKLIIKITEYKDSLSF